MARAMSASASAWAAMADLRSASAARLSSMAEERRAVHALRSSAGVVFAARTVSMRASSSTSRERGIAAISDGCDGKKAVKSGAAILLASHNMAEVERLCDQVLMMRQGRIVDRGTPGALLTRFGRATLEQVFLDIARAPDLAMEAPA